jgi:MFS family permease
MSGVLLAGTGQLFHMEILGARGMTVAWMIVFFFASAAASSAYLTVSETFPLETRALAIAVFYAIGTGIGGAAGPAIFGALVETGSRTSIFAGYLFGSVLMIAAAAIAAVWGVAAERKPLEAVARPLAFAD